MRPVRALILSLALAVPAATASGQGLGSDATPLALDLKKVPVGAWSEYAMSIGAGQQAMTVKSRWALVARDANSNTLETTIEGGPMAAAGGKTVMKMVLVPDPVKSDRPVKQMVMKVGDRDPMEMPLDMPGMPAQRFEKPDPKKMVGKEQLKVPGGTFKVGHYRDVAGDVTIDAWISEKITPLGLVKLTTTPKPGTTGPNGQPVLPMSMLLVAHGKDAKPTITKGAKPFDPAAFGPPRPPAR
jgi:hypothetical protein